MIDIVDKTFTPETEINEENCLKLAIALETKVSLEGFDIRRLSNGELTAYDPKELCGTIACALGWSRHLATLLLQ